MASWKEERDRLVAQTLAFVQHVAATHPGTASKITVEQPAIAASEATSPDAPPPVILADLPKHPVQYAEVSERSEIAQRVAAFKARQGMLNREREAYYDSVQARIRGSLRNDNGADRL